MPAARLSTIPAPTASTAAIPITPVVNSVIGSACAWPRTIATPSASMIAMHATAPAARIAAAIGSRGATRGGSGTPAIATSWSRRRRASASTESTTPQPRAVRNVSIAAPTPIPLSCTSIAPIANAPKL
jgi:hypothetical protein